VIGVVAVGEMGMTASTGVDWIKAVVGVGTGEGVGEVVTGGVDIAGVPGERSTFDVIGVMRAGDAGMTWSTCISATLLETVFFPLVARGAQIGEN